MNRHATTSDMKVSAAVRKLNPGVFNGVKGSDPIPASLPLHRYPSALLGTPDKKKRLRQDTKGPNKLEQAFEAWLRDEWKHLPGVEIRAQAYTLLLANGVRYTPDFIVVLPAKDKISYPDQRATLAFETKGFMREDAAVKIKVAARLYPWIKFHLVTKQKKKDGGGWAIEEVLP